MSTPAVSREAQAKADIYEFLARVFSARPTEYCVRVLCTMAAALGVDCPETVSLSELDREYVELFIISDTVNPSHDAAPWSLNEWPPEVFPHGRNLSVGGRAVVLPERDLPDHISNELLFVAYLTEQEAAGGDWEMLGAVRKQFVRDHVLVWVALLRERVLLRDRLGFYRAATDVVRTILHMDVGPVAWRGLTSGD